MIKTDKMPMWVFLAFSSINTRKGAIILIWSSLLFTIYCIPFTKFVPNNGWLAKLFLIDDWSWFAMMLPMTVWYWISLKWIDKHGEWENA